MQFIYHLFNLLFSTDEHIQKITDLPSLPTDSSHSITSALVSDEDQSNLPISTPLNLPNLDLNHRASHNQSIHQQFQSLAQYQSPSISISTNTQNTSHLPSLPQASSIPAIAATAAIPTFSDSDDENTWNSDDEVLLNM